MTSRNLIQALAVLLLGALVGGGVTWWSMRSDTPSGEPGTAHESGRKVLYWHDPMVPGTKFDKPGKSPFMDMDLVPVYEDEASTSGVRIAPAIAQNLGIRTANVEHRKFDRSLTAVGTVAFDERRVAVVQSRVSGNVLRLYVKAPLQAVKRGQPLLEVASPEWLAAQYEYLSLLDARSAAAGDIRAAARERLVVLGVPNTAIERIEQEKSISPTTMITAPVDGVVADLLVREGSSFPPATALMQINSLRTVWVNAQVPEAYVSHASAGTRASISSTAWPGLKFEGRVLELLPRLDEQTRTLTARIEVENRDDRLAPGMYVSADFARLQPPTYLSVPTEAVIVTGERTAVIQVDENGAYQVVDVSIGDEALGYTAVLKGLSEGQSVVTSGQFLIDSEASLKASISRLETKADDALSARTRPNAHLTTGTITAISPTEITVAHRPVASLNWPAMTMPFKKPESGIKHDLAVGDHVSFSFVQDARGGFRIISIDKADHDATEQMERMP